MRRAGTALRATRAERKDELRTVPCNMRAAKVALTAPNTDSSAKATDHSSTFQQQDEPRIAVAISAAVFSGYCTVHQHGVFVENKCTQDHVRVLSIV